MRVRETWSTFWLGVLESLQLHRCVILFVLDDTHRLWAKVLHCLLLNGCVFLGSVAWWMLALQPLLNWLITLHVAPLTGDSAAASIETLLHGLYHVCWLVPVYLVTLLVSCSWYNEMATMALQVQPRTDTNRTAASQPPPAVRDAKDAAGQPLLQAAHLPSLKPSPRASAAGFEEVAAQEVFRVVLFLVFYGQIWALGQLPYVGQPLYFIYSCWLGAYYCYDYAWALRGVSLSDRLSFFESSAPFFAGYGLIMTVVTLLLPFYIGAAVTALLFPLFVLVACLSDPPAIIASALLKQQRLGPGKGTTTRGRWPGLSRVPIFALALSPTKWLLRHIFRV